MIESYKYKSKIATAIAFIAMIIVSLGKDGLTKIIPAEYVWTIPVIVGIATWILAQKTEDKRVDVAEKIILEKFASLVPTEDVDPAAEYENLNPEYETVGDDDESC